ncbi:MAG: efflux RND transporter periplasmic adaptor subunit [Halioglobus sp.]
MLKKVMKLVIPLGIVIAAVLFAMLLVGSREQLKPTDAAEPLPHVQAIAVQLADVPISIVAHGNVRARYELELASEVTGRVVWVAPEFEPGEIVTAGTTLLRIDPVNYQLALAQANAAMATAKIALADAKALKRQAAIGEGELNIEAVRQRIVKAEQDLAYTEIKAPFNAVIDQQLVEYGQFISAGRTVARLLGSDTAEVTFPVTPAEAGFLSSSVGAGVTLTAQIGEQEQQWQARLVRIESRVDQLSRVVPVVVQVDSPYDTKVHAHTLPLGLFVTAILPGRPVSSAVRLPSSVLHANDAVFVVEDNALRRRQVNVVHREGNTIVVNNGLKTGDLVVTTRLDVMFEGMKVALVDG